MLDQNRILADLVSKPEIKRDGNWEKNFFEVFVSSLIDIGEGASKLGPDQWPYLFARSSPAAKEPVIKVLGWLSQRGIGLVLNGEKPVPDYIFTYGMIWNFVQHGQFLTPISPETKSKTVDFAAGQKIMAGPPSDDYLPSFVRSILKHFFVDQGILSPKILVTSPNQKDFDLCFSLESLGSPVESEHEGILEAVSWFLPAHYSLVLVSEKGLPGFVPL